MDARSDKKAIPLAVDLDGTLIATDLLWEGLFLLLRKNPLYLFLVPFWLRRGPGAAEAGDRRPRRHRRRLPALSRRDVLARLRDERAAGRKIILATGTPRKFAEAIAAHLGAVRRRARDRRPHNLTSGRKREALVDAYGDGGFDYAGNSRHDLKVFDAAREAIVVAPDRHAARWQAAHGSRAARGAEADLQDRPARCCASISG